MHNGACQMNMNILDSLNEVMCPQTTLSTVFIETAS